MSYRQLVDADMNTGYQGGWCLKFVQDAFGTDHPYPSAIDAWNANYGGGNHPYELPPEGKTVPVYFSLGNVPAGHVAISLDDGMVASSTQAGFNSSPYFHANMQDMINTYSQYNGGCEYLGWSEYVGTVKVIEEENMPSLVDTNVLRIVHSELEGWDIDKVHAGEYDELFKASWNGWETNAFLQRKWEDDTAFRERRRIAFEFYNKYSPIITDLEARPKEIVKEVPVEKIVYKEVPIGFDSLSLGELLSEAFKKLFKIK